MEVRSAAAEDAARLAEIWNREVLETLATTDTEPRDVLAQCAWLAARSPAHPVIVAEDTGAIAGFAALTPYRAKPAFRHTVEDSVYVDTPWRGGGVGRRLLARLLELGAAAGHHSVLARITADNAASRRLHEALGFRLIGLEEEVACKFGRWLDVALYQRRL
jgi:phosphinothricin acetyltransferase